MNETRCTVITTQGQKYAAWLYRTEQEDGGEKEKNQFLGWKD